MSNAITTQAPAINVTTAPALANKKGQVTTSAARAADIVNAMSNSAIVGAAMNGKGSIGKTARAALTNVVTLAHLCGQQSIDGGQWADMFGLLVQEFGTNPSGHVMTFKAKPRCAEYIKQVRVNLDARFINAETVKAQKMALAAMDHLTIVEGQVMRLLAASEALAAAALAASEAPTTQATTAPALEMA